MNRLAIVALALAPPTSLLAQANTVAGLDGRLVTIDNLTYYGRRGLAYPNGEAGMAMLNNMCNPGTVDIPWRAAMQPDHPFFGFMIVRVAGDRIEQINEWSFCKHAWLSVNSPSNCGTCNGSTPGNLLGIGCSDTYGAGNNSDREDLAPPEEIDPWLGTWDPVGSYFDIGDPNQPGFPAPADGVRSLTLSHFDTVEHRVTVDEADLVTPNADYYYGLQLVIEGEAVANRDDNLAHRGFNPNWSGSSWSFANNSATQEHGSILDRWPGAYVDVGQNGNDDGRFFVAVKATALGGGNFHYEYAVHNVDNSRAGATLRIPIDANATATNFTFRDIDDDATNDWTAARVGNEIVFTATATNPLEWNTIYNFGFDANFPPGLDTAKIDEARIGPGALSVDIPTQSPSGQTIATFTTFGDGCPGSLMSPTSTCSDYNPSGGTLTQTLDNQEYAYRVNNANDVNVVSFEVFTSSSTGNTETVPAHIYAGSPPIGAPLASTTIDIGPTPGFYTATFANPVNVSSVYSIALDISGQTVYVSDLATGSVNIGYSRDPSTNNWSLEILRPSWSVSCFPSPQFLTPVLSSNDLPTVGSSYQMDLEQAAASSFATLAAGLSSTDFNGNPLPAALPGVPGCEVLIAPDAMVLVPTTAAGTANFSVPVPNNPGLAGFELYHQWAVLDASANSFGLALSNAAALTVGL